MTARIHLPSGLVTFLFTDIEGSTRLARMLGAGYRPVLAEHRRLVRSTLTASDGAELLTEGDSFFAAFADAGAALDACLAAQRALADHDWPSPEAEPKVRMGMHTGYAEPHAGEYASPEVHRAARVAAAAHGGQVLCSAATARHAALPADTSLLDLGLYRLRGFDDRERLFQVVAPGLARQFPRIRTAEAAPHNLPRQATSFVGRIAERAELADLMAANRLVTVVGAGGAGKTRLAVEFAQGQVENFTDGVWFVDVAAVTDPGLVAFSVATALGLRPEPGRPIADTLVEYVASRRMLLILDTCDAQLSGSAQIVARLLAGSGGVKVLATSREPFGIPSEVVWRIPPLSLEEGPGGAPSDSVALLLDRTAAARGGRRATPAEMVHVGRVTGRLDGLPLAIELAAARLRVLSVAQLAERLDDVLGTLDAGRGETGLADDGLPTVDLTAPAVLSRHSTMQATVTWSYRTLGPRAARLLRGLSVFAGPVDLETVEWLLDDDPLDPLAVLVDKSLIQAEHRATGTTYRILDPIRAYAARRLVEAGEEQSARDRHVAWSLDTLQRVHLGPDGQAVTLSMYALDRLADEVRAALRWTATRGSGRLGLRLAAGLDQWWHERGLAREGRLWLFRLYGRIAETGEAVPDVEFAHAYRIHSRHAGADGEFHEEMRFTQQAEAAARQANDPGLLARVLSRRGTALMELGRLDEAERSCRGVIRWAERHEVSVDALEAVTTLAVVLWRRGDLDQAADLLAGARPLEAARPADRGRRTIDMLLGVVALGRLDLVAAHDHLMVALRARMAYGFHSRACDTISAIATRCALGGDPVTAARLFGGAQATRAVLRTTVGAYGTHWRDQQDLLRGTLGDRAFDAAYGAGTAMTLDEAAALALAIDHPDLSEDSVRFSDLNRRA